jgi:hypothetical protein
MKKLHLLLLPVLLFCALEGRSQENYGNTLNLGAGIGYYGYIGHPVPNLNLNYEFDLPGDFTLAPFIGFYTYTNSQYWGDPYQPYRYYTYRETVVPVGLKLAYYFDELFQAGPKWDFYAAASAGFAVRSVSWEDNYDGNRTLSNDASPLYLNLHIGARYDFTPRTGIFLDLSTGVSSVGLSFHFTPHKNQYLPPAN